MRWIIALIAASVILAPVVSPIDPAAQDREHPYARPGLAHPLGTDEFGRDQFSRLLHGGRVSLFAGTLATALALGCGLLLGGTAGYLGGLADELIMRTAEVFLCLPWLYLLLAVRAFLPLTLDTVRSFLLIVAIIGVLGWTRPAILVRGLVLSARELPYVLAARGFGGSHRYVLRRHLLPLVWPIIRTQAAILAPRYVLAEVSLTFLGLGVGEPASSWGQQLAIFRHLPSMETHPWALLPPAVVVLIIFTLLWLTDDAKQV